nr:MAG TPA: hypothetical protein [Caudoviricetes sp.]
MSHQPPTPTTQTDTEEAKLQALKHLQHRLNLHSLHDLHQDSGRLKNKAGTVSATATDTESLYYIAEAVNTLHALIGDYQDQIEENQELKARLERYQTALHEVENTTTTA